MTQVMQFDPSQWVQVTMTEQNKPAVLKAIKDSLTGPNPAPVPIGFAVYDQQAAQQAPYTWSADLLKANGQPQLDGGHEILIVNGRTDSSGNVIGVTAQNSWGTGIGNDVNGNPTNVAANSGFFNITTPYLDYTVPNDAPDFVFSKALVNGNPSLPPDPATIKPGKSPRLK